MATRTSIFLTALLFGLFTGGFLALYFVLDAKYEKEYYEKYTPTTFTARNSASSNRTCSDKISCACENVDREAPSCSSAKSSHTSGPCNDGYHCCEYDSDICYDTCTRRKCSGTGDNRRCRTETYNCRPHECNKRCVQSVDRQYCEIAVGTCYTATVYFSYIPESNKKKYDECVDKKTKAEEATDSCVTTFEIVASLTKGFGRDKLTATNTWLAKYPSGKTFKGYYETKNTQKIYLKKLEAYSSPGGVIFLFVLGIICGVGTLGFVGYGCNYKAKKKTGYRSRDIELGQNL